MAYSEIFATDTLDQGRVKMNAQTSEIYTSLTTVTKNLITGATTAVVGVENVCSGTSADYTVTLPTAVGIEGQMVCIKGDPDSTILTKVITIDGAGTEKIDNSLTKKIAYGGFCTLVARVTGGVGSWDVISFDQGAWIAVTLTPTGFSSAPSSVVARWRISGKQAHLEINTNTGTSNTTAFTFTGLPSEISPPNLTLWPMILIDNGTRINGRAQIAAAATTLTLFATANAGNFTASGAKGVDALYMTWSLA